MAGLQCPKRLWLATHEPDAPELVPDMELQARFDCGHRVGELARAHLPGGVLIDLPHWQIEQRVAATARALQDGAQRVYEASFLQDGIFVAIDVLSRVRSGFALSEVKATLSVKDEHIVDVAVQVHVAAKAGLAVRRAELIHLNRACTYPDLSQLFTRQDVTAPATAARREVPRTARGLLKMLAGPQPQCELGEQCVKPYRCPFFERCQPELSENHVSTLYRIRRDKLAALEAKGIHSLNDLDVEQLPDGPQRRQVESVQQGRVVISPRLRAALGDWKLPIAFLDLETISPAVPTWPGCAPYQAVPVQMSCHVLSSRGLTHAEWLASGSTDPREALARAVLSACAGARTVVAYNASFERSRLLDLGTAIPKLRRQLHALADRISDLLQVVRDHVYHPAFGGSFSLKSVLPALVPELSYKGLAIVNGAAASIELEHLLLGAEAPTGAHRAATRLALLDYCRMDTYGMVRIYQWLCARAASPCADFSSRSRARSCRPLPHSKPLRPKGEEPDQGLVGDCCSASKIQCPDQSKLKAIPRFKSEAEEREFWLTHDLMACMPYSGTEGVEAVRQLKTQQGVDESGKAPGERISPLDESVDAQS